MTSSQRQTMQVLIQPGFDRIVYLWIDKHKAITGINYEQGAENTPNWDTLPSRELYEKLMDMDKTTLNNTIDLINAAIEEYSAPKYYLIFSLNDNKLYSLEVLHGEVDREDLPRYISNKIRGDFEFMEVNSDYEAGNMVELCKL